MARGKKKSSSHDSDLGRILVGTASWSDPGFVQRWYPKGIRPHERLGWYAQYFETVEVNSTFYSVPDSRMVERFLRSMSVLRSAGKLGVFLLQLSPAFSPRAHKLEELEHLISMLRDYRLAIEFRNRNWATGDQLKSTIDFLKRRR